MENKKDTQSEYQKEREKQLGDHISRINQLDSILKRQRSAAAHILDLSLKTLPDPGGASFKLLNQTKVPLSSYAADETASIAAAIDAMHAAVEKSPLPDHVKVYAMIELAFKLGDRAYVEEVFNEILLFKPPT